uniref:Uncharacterized protein n=1 Tax=Erpetoichthys calabaricus TaxID=27687 RepID=A0A8C4X478_ERPCA
MSGSVTDWVSQNDIFAHASGQVPTIYSNSLKAAILAKYEINTETYCIRFHYRLQPNKHLLEQIIDFIVLEQLLQKHCSKTSKEAPEVAEIFMSAHHLRNLRKKEKVSLRSRTIIKAHRYVLSLVDMGCSSTSIVSPPAKSENVEGWVRLGCGQKGHMIRSCLNRHKERKHWQVNTSGQLSRHFYRP